MELDTLEGTWRVVRTAGLLPPFGLSKRIGRGRGWTCLFGVPVAPFVVRGTELRYRLLPVADILRERGDGTWDGKATVVGFPFCRFRLVRTRP